MMTTTILALDLATQTGCALHQLTGITSGTERFKPPCFEGGGMRFLRFKHWLAELKQLTDGFEAVFFEEVRRHTDVNSAYTHQEVPV